MSIKKEITKLDGMISSLKNVTMFDVSAFIFRLRGQRDIAASKIGKQHRHRRGR